MDLGWSFVECGNGGETDVGACAFRAARGHGAGCRNHRPADSERAGDKLPLVPGSSIKGCLKDTFEPSPERRRYSASRRPRSPSGGGRTIAPVAGALPGATFLWVTSPYVLRRLRRDLEAAGMAKGAPEVPDIVDGRHGSRCRTL